MKEFIDKLINRLEKEKEGAKRRKSFDSEISYSCAISIVNQLAEEYNNESVKGDLISRSLLLKAIDECLEDCENHMTEPSIWNVISIVKRQPTAYNDGWIPCSSGELPKSGKSVIVSYKDRFLTQADGTCEGWYDATNMMWHLTDYEYSDNVEVIAWRERLAPYQPKGCEKKLTTCADCEDSPCELTPPVQPKGE